MKKKGQFYLLAAIIIIVVIVGFAATTNYLSQKNEVKIYDLKDELGIEGQNVIDFGVLNKDKLDSQELIDHFTTIYNEYAGDDKELFFIYGSKNSISAFSYTDVVSGTINLQISGEPLGIAITKRVKNDLKPSNSGDKVTVIIKDSLGQETTRQFDLNDGENFYFVIQQEIDGEKHVVQG